MRVTSDKSVHARQKKRGNDTVSTCLTVHQGNKGKVPREYDRNTVRQKRSTVAQSRRGARAPTFMQQRYGVLHRNKRVNKHTTMRHNRAAVDGTNEHT